mmetsp:Transcript_40465/g.56229  ORF Transcript_40465/g.56229 Transcript_40465/m.56229 type:complete len:400 (-) Transcript_40465:145-1344(-)
MSDVDGYPSSLLMPDVSGFHPTLGRSHIAQLQNQIQDRPQMQAHVGHLMQSHHGSIGNQAQMGMQSQLSVHQNHLSPHQSDDMMHHVNHVMGESDPGVQLQDGDNGDPLIGDDEVSGEIKVGTEKDLKDKRQKLSPRRKYKRYTPEQLRWAVNYMRKEKTTAGKAAKAAEKQFDLPADTIPKSTIWHYSHNPNRQIGKRPGVGTVLSDAEEKVLADHVGKSSSLGQLIGKRAIKELATKMLQNAGRHGHVKTRDGVLSNKWYKGFMKRHPHLKRQRGRSSSSVNVTNQATQIMAAQAVQAASLQELPTGSMNIDTRGIQRGNCNECECSEYERPPDSITNDCFYCGHKPPSHKNLGPGTIHHPPMNPLVDLEDQHPTTDQLHNLSGGDEIKDSIHANDN